MSHPSLDASTLEIAKDLIARQSVTPADAGCQAFMAEYLNALGFDTEHMDFADTQNIWSIRTPEKASNSPCFVFAGHTDVVPPGPSENWHTPPFEPVVKDGVLYGRGAADMKGSLAAMLTATRRFVAEHPEHKGSIAFLITSDEEGPFINGTVKVVEELQKRGQAIDYSIVGEPSSTAQLGDVIKIGRRGSLTGWLKIEGIQGHVAYPHLADNAVHRSAHFLDELINIKWDEGNEHFPPTSLQVTQINAGEAVNIVPGEVKLEFNLRYSTEQSHQRIKQQVETLVKKHCDNYQLDWKLNGEPFLTESHDLIDAVANAIKQVCSVKTSPQTSGGTSDGRFIAKTGAQIVELGPINKTIHQVNECVKVDDLELLSEIYYLTLKQILV
ncbi:succinyl-diaminopimelate desuccinylase [Aliikangiella coralliicola]|uniref:Succinyl-diaminopimelate desuccinylase n=1 Tax=Aliikangiella coralliicola TaxID=2592383 RepID=A0A545TW84_9GAMM|nr:succinyl-diaminopimelate desuccinylase [Aliikangiella coralliicola]TQV81487.1 succinyl-diaminopimelate desuccinylase [Aliikangiella coralliicola]